MSSRRPLLVRVAGGELSGEVSGREPDRARAVVVALHGLTSNSLAWRLVTSRLADDITAVAFDLRGRAASAGLPAPYGIAAHADDAAAVLDALGVSSAVVVGHAMGAFVATTMAERHRERVDGLVLVDGGVPFGPDDVAGPALADLRRRFASRDDALAYWRTHPAMAGLGRWNDVVEAHVLHGLGGSPPELRSRADDAAVRFDIEQLTSDPAVADAIERLRVPTELLRVDRGPSDEPTPSVALHRAFDIEARVESLRVVSVPGLNHHTIVLHPQGADAVAGAIARIVAAVRPG